MKKYSFLFLAMMAVLWGCSDDDKPTDDGGTTTNEPTIEISPVNGDEGSAVYATSAIFNLRANGVESYAYQIVEGKKTDSPAGEVIYAGAMEEGGSGINTLKEGDNNVTIYGLEGNKTYTVFFAFKADKDYILKSQVITTPAYTRLITPISIGRDNIKFHIEVGENTNYRYAVTDYVNYYTMRQNWGHTDADFITYGTLGKGAQTIEVNNDDDEYAMFYPGMAYVVLIGECDEDGNPLFTITGGGGGGDLLSKSPLENLGDYTEEFKEEACVYNGKYARLRFWTEAPESVESTTKLEILKKTESYVKAAITPGDGVVSYGVGVVEENDYQEMLSIVGEKGINSFIFYNYTTPLVDPTEVTFDGLTVGSKYKLYVISNYNDNDYNKQSVFVQDVEITKSTMPQSQLELTFIQNNDPYSVTFNVKAPNKDCYGIRYLMNYSNDWASAPFDDERMLTVYGQEVKNDEFLNKVNSNEGFDIKFDSWEDTESKMILVSYNEEEGRSDIYTITGTSAKETGTPLDSPIFEKLTGTWTASYNFTKGGTKQTLEFPITLTQNADEGPATISGMDKSVYDNLVKYWMDNGRDEATAKAKVEESFNDYKVSAAKYTKKYKDMNRVVGNGFKPLYDYYSTWNLFCDLTYSAATNDELFYDYGPKIFFQVFKDEATGEDKVILATYEYAIPPMMSGVADMYDYYLFGNNVNSGGNAFKNVNFPVTLSEDGNEMTIHGIKSDQVDYILYPSVCYYMGNYPMFHITGEGDLVLKKGGDAAANTSRRSFNLVNPSDVKLKPAYRGGNRFMKTYIPSEKTMLKFEKATVRYTSFDEKSKASAKPRLK